MHYFSYILYGVYVCNQIFASYSVRVWHSSYLQLLALPHVFPIQFCISYWLISHCGHLGMHVHRDVQATLMDSLFNFLNCIPFWPCLANSSRVNFTSVKYSTVLEVHIILCGKTFHDDSKGIIILTVSGKTKYGSTNKLCSSLILIHVSCFITVLSIPFLCSCS